MKELLILAMLQTGTPVYQAPADMTPVPPAVKTALDADCRIRWSNCRAGCYRRTDYRTLSSCLQTCDDYYQCD
jgi:hypothetical protein